jgi:hypothetical protein
MNIKQLVEIVKHLDPETKSNVASMVGLVPALILTKKGVSAFGLRDSLRVVNQVVIMKQNKVVTTIYLAALGTQVYYAVKSVKASLSRVEEIKSQLPDDEDWLARILLPVPEVDKERMRQILAEYNGDTFSTDQDEEPPNKISLPEGQESKALSDVAILRSGLDVQGLDPRQH